MPNIQISELTPAGLDLFQDSESFLNALQHDELLGVTGGRSLASLINSNISIQLNTAFSAISNSINANTVGNANTAIG